MNELPWSFCETPEEKCTTNYCDENGCQNRKRCLVNPIEKSDIKINANFSSINKRSYDGGTEV